MRIRTFRFFLNSSINIIMDDCYNENPSGMKTAIKFEIFNYDVLHLSSKAPIYSEFNLDFFV